MSYIQNPKLSEVRTFFFFFGPPSYNRSPEFQGKCNTMSDPISFQTFFDTPNAFLAIQEMYLTYKGI